MRYRVGLLRELLAGPVDNDDDVAEAIALLRASTGITEAKRTVQRYAEEARAELTNLPEGPGRVALASLVEYTVNRHG